jgi:hypothetical protein
MAMKALMLAGTISASASSSSRKLNAFVFQFLDNLFKKASLPPSASRLRREKMKKVREEKGAGKKQN